MRSRSTVVKKVWFYFRIGHTTYFGFVLHMVNFVMLLTLYLRLLLHLETYLLAVVVVLVLLAYIAAAAFAGWQHVRRVMPTELEVTARRNPWVETQGSGLNMFD